MLEMALGRKVARPVWVVGAAPPDRGESGASPSPLFMSPIIWQLPTPRVPCDSIIDSLPSARPRDSATSNWITFKLESALSQPVHADAADATDIRIQTGVLQFLPTFFNLEHSTPTDKFHFPVPSGFDLATLSAEKKKSDTLLPSLRFSHPKR
jgi:hypothetical protein